jgi:hypothetical protein
VLLRFDLPGYQLLDLCALTKTLIADSDGVYPGAQVVTVGTQRVGRTSPVD